MNNRLRLLDYVFLTRPILFFPGWATLLVGYIAASGELNFISHIFLGISAPTLFGVDLFWSSFAFTCAMGGCFVLNQVYDIDTDSENKKLFLIGDGFISINNGYRESFFLLLLSLICASFLSSELAAAILVFNLVTGLLYNVQPFAFKNRPVWGLVANMAMGWLAFAVGWLAVSEASISLLNISLPVLFFNTALYFLTTLPDVAGDARTGKVTFPVRFGKRATIVLCIVFFIMAIVTALWHKNEFMLVVTALTTPFMVRLAVKKTVPAAIIAVKAGIAIFALAVCVKFPLFFVMMALTFFITRFYYKNRFDFDYPNFRGR